jgi:hypothetical protein
MHLKTPTRVNDYICYEYGFSQEYLGNMNLRP